MPEVVLVTPSEFVQTLRHSSLPTIVTEGSDDYAVFRRVEERLSELGVSLMPVGGKQTVLEIFKCRDQFRQIRTAFIMDRDLWIFAAVPQEYADDAIIITDGYSIENDLYRDGDMEALLLANERAAFFNDLKEIVKWYSFAVRRRLDGGDVELDCHPRRVLNDAGQIDPSFALQVGYTGPCTELCDDIREKYARLLRGKTLLSLLLKYLSHKDRAIKHSRKSLMEAASVRGGAYIKRIYDTLERIFY